MPYITRWFLVLILQFSNSFWMCLTKFGSLALSPIVRDVLMSSPFQNLGRIEAITANFRPISLTSNVGKLMKKMVNVRLTHYLESNKCIPRSQYGFRKMLGTTDALPRLTADVQASLSCGHQVLCVSFDLQKAYDTTWKRGILNTLPRPYQMTLVTNALCSTRTTSLSLDVGHVIYGLKSGETSTTTTSVQSETTLNLGHQCRCMGAKRRLF